MERQFAEPKGSAGVIVRQRQIDDPEVRVADGAGRNGERVGGSHGEAGEGSGRGLEVIPPETIGIRGENGFDGMEEKGGACEKGFTISEIDKQLKGLIAAESGGDIEFEKRKLQSYGDTASDFCGEAGIGSGKKEADSFVLFTETEIQ